MVTDITFMAFIVLLYTFRQNLISPCWRQFINYHDVITHYHL
jgi:hypothetical protein